MKKLITLIFLFFSTNLIASELAIIDIEFIFANSKKGKLINSEIIKTNNDLKEKFLSDEKKFTEREANIRSKKNILSTEEYDKEVNKFKEDLKIYNQKKQKKFQEIQEINSKKIKDFYEILNNVLINYSNENNIQTVIDKKYILISKSNSDITNLILEILNK
jgi:Skp family chaperone for outer membrane proteins